MWKNIIFFRYHSSFIQFDGYIMSKSIKRYQREKLCQLGNDLAEKKKNFFLDKMKKLERKRYAAEKEEEIKKNPKCCVFPRKGKKLIGLSIEMLIVIQKAVLAQTRFVVAKSEWKIRCQRLVSHMCECLSSTTFLWILLFFFYNRINEL